MTNHVVITVMLITTSYRAATSRCVSFLLLHCSRQVFKCNLGASVDI